MKKRRQDERLLRTVDRVGDKIDSLEESLARREQENQFAESLLNNLIDDDEATSSIVQHNHVLDQVILFSLIRLQTLILLFRSNTIVTTATLSFWMTFT